MQVTWWIPSRRIQARLDDRFPITAPPVGARARRIAAASNGTKATSLGTGRVDHAAWPMPSLRARRSGINHLECERDAGQRFPRPVLERGGLDVDPGPAQARALGVVAVRRRTVGIVVRDSHHAPRVGLDAIGT